MSFGSSTSCILSDICILLFDVFCANYPFSHLIFTITIAITVTITVTITNHHPTSPSLVSYVWLDIFAVRQWPGKYSMCCRMLPQCMNLHPTDHLHVTASLALAC